MITDENIIELFFARSEQGMRELDIKYGKVLPQSFLPYRRESGKMRKNV